MTRQLGVVLALSIAACTILLVPRSARAACGGFACTAGHLTTASEWVDMVSTADAMRFTIKGHEYANVGLSLQTEGPQFAVAAVGGEDRAMFVIYDDRTARFVMKVTQPSLFPETSNPTSQENIEMGGSVYPLLDNTYVFGGSARRWTAVYAVNGTIQTSDLRAKKDVQALGYGLPQLLRLRPVSFKWKTGDDTKTHLGLIAQEVEKVIPDIVSHGEKESDLLGMNYSDLVPVLISAVQAQQKVIVEQGDRITKLEHSRVAAGGPSSFDGGAWARWSALPLVGLGLVWNLRRRRATPEPKS